MADKIQQLEKERKKALGEVLVLECRADEPNQESLEVILQNGAEVTFSHAKALYWATKKLNFGTVKFLIRNGVLIDPIATTYIAKICDQKGFSEEKEEAFFEVLDLCRAKTEQYMELFVPYINHMAVTGRMDKLRSLMQRYYITEAEIASVIYIRIIFEIILNAHDEVLAFINKHIDWQDQAAFDLAVSSGDWMVLEYLYAHGAEFTPSETAVAQAVYSGFFPVLDIILHHGYQFNKNPKFLKKACRAAFIDGGAALNYLFERGYTAQDHYEGCSISENAIKDGNETAVNLLIAKLS